MKNILDLPELLFLHKKVNIF